MKFLLNFLFILLSQHISSLKLDESPFEVPRPKGILVGEINSKQGNCLVIRNIMEALPAYTPIKHGVVDYFSKGKVQNMKAFREIAMNVFKEIDYEDEEKRTTVKAKMDELVSLKTEYNEKFRDDIDLNIDEEEQEEANIKSQIAQIEIDIKNKKEDIDNFLGSETDKMTKIIEFSRQSLEDNSRNSLKNTFAEYQYFKNYQAKAGIFFYDDEEIDDFRTFITTHFPKDNKKSLPKIDNLILKSKEQRTLKSVKEGMVFYDEVAMYRHKTDQDTSRLFIIPDSQVSNAHKTVDDYLKNVKKEIQGDIKYLQGLIAGKMKDIKKVFKKNKTYQKYIQNIKTVKKIRKIISKYYEDLENFENSKDKLNQKLGNLAKDKDMNFTIAQDSIEGLQKKIKLLDTKAEIFDTRLITGYSDDFNKKILSIMEEFKLGYNAIKKVSDEKLDAMILKIKLSVKIDELEKFFDIELGQIFAEIQNMDNGMRCFTKSQLSYIFFGMVKTNTIIKENDFLFSFLTKIPYLMAKEFIVFNYSIFANEEFILSQRNKDDLIESLDLYRTEEQKSVITTYINNWSFLVNSYKDYTEYGTKSEGKKVKKAGLGSRLCRILGVTAQKFFNLSKDSGYNEYFATFAGELLKMIPFLGNVPFLTSILATVLAYLTEFIIDLIFKFFANAAPVIKSFMLKVGPVFGVLLNKEVYDLDYKKYLDEGVEVDEEDDNETAKITVNITDIEKEYISKIEEAENGDIEDLYLFDNSNLVIDPSKVRKAVVQEGLDRLEESGLLEENESLKYQQIKEQLDSQSDDQQRQNQGANYLKSKRLLTV
jgi:hypothetical protein